ncbi:PAS domain-containing sensor histidine kinase [Bacillus sp. FJAT-27225]|uniref:cell wall metabolism sensor histidine kinase WalK n=1 Tax=Bacillus sp. FJAT-27225 TaxID=1743144 RepID=UPI00080C2CA7|nr:cell wall metabolism sensor histidine kinase WalK [Bacillus sp. FJAT-27225]OCA82202.1 PAS domain-containing sensor histidine kinase [Bacillus sp. FJAT-27225]
MRRVGFLNSIRLKLVLMYILLILVAGQIIGVYFVRQLEETLTTNFQTSLKGQVNMLGYNLVEQMEKERTSEDPTLEDDVRKILSDFAVGDDITEARFIGAASLNIIGTSEPGDQNVVGKRTTELRIKRALLLEEEQSDILIDRSSGHRIWVLAYPVKSEGKTIGAIYLEANIESVFEQMNTINSILATGTAIALGITAILGTLLAQTITRPITDMKKQAIAMAKGNFSRKVKVYGHDEIGTLAMTFNNLTKKLQEAQATTEGERRKLSSVLSYMTDGVIATDRRGRVIVVNEPAAKMLGVSRETVLSEPIVALLDLQDTYTFEELLEINDSIILDYSTKHNPYILKANLSVIQKETGFVNGLITVLHDITEQEKIDAERREFVANVSHELRTPLTTMRSYLEALADGVMKDPEVGPQFLNVAQTETERMIRLVNDLLQLSKMDSRDYRLSKEWIDFTEFFNRIIDRFEMTKEENVRFTRILPRKPLFVDIDEDKLTQVLDNIISNAMKYSPEGGEVTFTVVEEVGKITVSVKDEGIGIPKENVGKIFDRFYRVDKARTRKLGGTGLGLAIAKEMIMAHGGTIWATSEEGKGTQVIFTLPYEPSEEVDWA